MEGTHTRVRVIFINHKRCDADKTCCKAPIRYGSFMRYYEQMIVYMKKTVHQNLRQFVLYVVNICDLKIHSTVFFGLFDTCSSMWFMWLALSGFPQVLCPGKSWIILGFVNFYEKSWKSPGMLHNICPTNFVFQVVCNEFLPSWYVRYSTSFFLLYLPVSRIKI